MDIIMHGEQHTGNRGSSNNTTNMSHKEMFLRYIADPLLDCLQGTFDYLVFKLILIIWTIPAAFALELFNTPSDWWKGLLYLVVFDWVAGIVSAVKRGEFDARVMVRKWYMVTGYIVVCGSAAILSNTFSLFYYFQFLVYITFFLKEFVSILQTFNLILIFQAAWESFSDGSLSLSDFINIMDKINQRNNRD